MSRIANVLPADAGDGFWSFDELMDVSVMGMVIVEGRECAMRDDGLRGNSSRNGPKPVTRTLITSESMLEVEMLDSDSELGVRERGGDGDGGMMISRPPFQ